MLKIAGAIRRTYIFPAPLPAARQFYTQLDRLFDYLPHITMVEQVDQKRFRTVYESTELGAYSIRIYADIQGEFDDDANVLYIRPFDTFKPFKSKARVNSSAGQGLFGIRSTFTSAGRQTRIEYELDLTANLPRPLGLRFMPGSVLDRIANGITQRRMREIAEGFVENSIEAFLSETISGPSLEATPE